MIRSSRSSSGSIRPRSSATTSTAASCNSSCVSYSGRPLRAADRGSELCGGPERLELAAGGELGERLALELADGVGGDAEPSPRLAQGRRLVAVDPVAQHDHVALGL